MNGTHEDGPQARPFCLSLLLALAALAAFRPASAREDFFSAVLDLDYVRDLGLSPSEAAPIGPDASPFPGLAGFSWRFDRPRPAAGASLGLAYENLLRKRGDPDFAHDRREEGGRFRLASVPGLALQAALERAELGRDIGDSSLVLDQGTRAWQGAVAAAFPLDARVVPVVAAGWDSETGRGQGLIGAALLGRTRNGIAWSVASGRRSLEFPLALDLPEYKPMGVPFLLRQEFHAAALEVRRGSVEAAWSARLLRNRRPGFQATPYALGDSGWIGGQAFRLACLGGKALPWRLEARLESGSGRHFFKGRSQDAEGRYQFGYLEALQRNLSGRLEGGLDLGRQRLSAYGGGAALEWNAFRPEVPAGKVFWDRNAVLDSYEGSLIGVFNRETWLLDADARLLRAFAGMAWQAGDGPRPRRFRQRYALTWQRVEFSARSHITQRTDVGILARSVEEIERAAPGVAAHLLIPEVEYAFALGAGLRLGFRASQAIPVHVDLDRPGGGGGGTSGPGGSEAWSGGTRVSGGLDWNWP